MAKKASFIGSAQKVFSETSRSFSSQHEQIHLRIHVDDTADRSLVLALKDAFVPQRYLAKTEVLGIESSSEIPASLDMVLVIVGSRDITALLRFYLRQSVRVVLVAESPVDLPELYLSGQEQAYLSLVFATNPQVLMDKLGLSIAEVCDNPVAFGSAYDFLKAPVAAGIIKKAAVTNVCLGAIKLFRGSDFLLMLSNQLIMSMELASLYGKKLSRSLAAEASFVLLAAVVYKELASRGVRHVPMLALGIKAASAFCGTMLSGYTLKSFYELKDLPQDLIGNLEDLASKLVSVIGPEEFSFHLWRHAGPAGKEIETSGYISL